MLCSKCSCELPNDAVVCPKCNTPVGNVQSGVAALKIVKTRPKSIFRRKNEGEEKPFKALYKVYVMIDDKEFVSRENPIVIPIVPGTRNIKISDKSFKIAALKNMLGDIVSVIGDRDAFLVGQFIKFEASEVLSIEGADITFEENKTLVIKIVKSGYGLDIVDAVME